MLAGEPQIFRVINFKPNRRTQMTYFKVELTEAQLSKKLDLIIEHKLKDNNMSFSTNSTNRPKTIYFSSDESGLKIIEDPLYIVSSCSSDECNDLQLTSW